MGLTGGMALSSIRLGVHAAGAPVKTERRLGSLVLSLLLILVLPGSVAASAYSVLTYTNTWKPPGQSSFRTVCVQSAILDVAQNHGQIVIFSNSGQSCTAPNYAVPSGWIGVQIEGWRSGSFCGSTGYHYSNVSTSAWRLWSHLCSNPLGSQTFRTHTKGTFWTGNGYTNTPTIGSPNQNY
jgi:hypothetical protein